MASEDIVELSKKLISLPSTDNNPEELEASLDIIAGMLNRPGINIKRFSRNNRPSLFAYTTPKFDQHFRVILNGHVDVVPGTADQFKPYIKGNKLYGRGALDMKCTALIMTRVFAELCSELPFPIALQIVTDEEIGGHDGTGYQVEYGMTADLVISGEATGLHICNKSKGFCRVKLSLSGVSAHGAYLWRGRNAAVKLIQDIQKILDVYPVPENEVWRTTVNLAKLTTGDNAINQVPDIATAELDIRYIAEDDNFKNEKSMRQFFKEIDPNMEVDLTTKMEPPHKADPKTVTVCKLEQAIKQVTNKTPDFIKKHGGADCRYYEHAITFGPNGSAIHGDKEYIDLSTLKDYDDILRIYLKSLQGK